MNFDTEVGDGQWGWLSLASSFKDDHHQEDDQDHFDHDDDDQDVDATTGAKRLLEIIIKNLDDQDRFDHDDDDQDVDDNDQDQDPGSLC